MQGEKAECVTKPTRPRRRARCGPRALGERERERGRGGGGPPHGPAAHSAREGEKKNDNNGNQNEQQMAGGAASDKERWDVASAVLCVVFV